jgi:BlaI family transcriptional regulator, penicillinase repressor
MARRASLQPTDGELEILRVLWEAGPTELGALCAALRRQRPVATTTVATMLKVMLAKGLVKRGSGPRGYRWSARVSRKSAAAGMLRKLLDRLFEGSARGLVAHLIEDGRLSAQDREAIRRMLAEDDEDRKPGEGPRP